MLLMYVNVIDVNVIDGDTHHDTPIHFLNNITQTILEALACTNLPTYH